ncbi:MAG: tyrosine-type recombinase/integrase [Myxococcota bacterium]
MAAKQDDTLPKGLQRLGNGYRVQYKDSSGRWRQVSVGSDLGVALQRHRELRGCTDSVGPRFPELAERYLKRQEIYSKASTVHNERCNVEKLRRFFGARTISSMSSSDLEAFISSRRGKVSAHTINNDLGTFRGILRQAVDEGAIPALPFRIRKLRSTGRKIEILSAADVKRLLAAADTRTRAIIAVAAGTGLRRQEILHLKWEDIRGERLEVSPKDGWTTKTFQRRTVYLSPSLRKILADYRETLKHKTETDWVFQSSRSDGSRVGEIAKPLRATFARAGLYQRGKLLHLLRHSVASALLQNGTAIHVAQSILGHSRLETTARYLHSTEDAKRVAASRALV